MFINLKSVPGTALMISAVATGFAFAGAHTASAADNEQTSTAKVSLSLPSDAAVGIKSAPDLDFGSQAISTQQTTMKVASQPEALVVSNPGLASTWSVKVSASDFTKDGSTRTIQGAQIVMGNGSVSAENANNVSTKPTAASDVAVDAGGSSVGILSSATDGSSVGNFADAFSTDQVQLVVPAGNVAGNYAASLTWELSSTPA